MNTPETMTKHDFSDLTPPEELLLKWRATSANFPSSFTPFCDAYRAGAGQAAERLANEWPTPITDRPPTEADGDPSGAVQFLTPAGVWSQCHWSHAVNDWAGRFDPWLHTPRWQPPAPPTLKQQAIQAFKRRYPKRQYFDDGTGNAVEVNAELFADLDLIRRALEADS